MKTPLLKKQLAFIFTMITFLFVAKAQAPVIQWQNSYGGTGDDFGNAVIQCNDGGYIVAGASNSIDGDVTGNHGDYDYWIVKLDNAGILQWQKSFGGAATDRAGSIAQTNDHGFIVAGESYSNDGDVTNHHGTINSSDYWIVKLDSTGNLQWQKSFGGTSDDIASAVLQTYEGGYIVAGSSNSNDGDVTGHHGLLNYSDEWIVKLDSSGGIQWQKSLGGSNGDGAYNINQTSDHGYIISGATSSNDGDVTGNHGGISDFWIVKLDSSGNLQWQKCLGGTQDDEQALGIIQTQDGGYITSGWTNSNNDEVSGNHGNYDYWIVKLDASGNIQWQKCLGGTNFDGASNIQQLSSGDYVAIGQSLSNDDDVSGHHGVNDYWVVQLDTSGILEWEQSYGGSGIEAGFSIGLTNDAGYILGAASSSNDGNVSGHHGDTSSIEFGHMDYWIVKLSATTGIQQQQLVELLNIFPNPVSDKITLSFSSSEKKEIQITNTLGQVIFSKEINTAKEEIDVRAFPKGMYEIWVNTFSQKYFSKFLKQ